MSEINIDEILAKVDEFKKTIADLGNNLDKFKGIILDNIKKYGKDSSKWPEK